MQRGQEAKGLFAGSLALSLGMHLLAALWLLSAGNLHRPEAPPVLTVSLVTPGGGEAGGPGKGDAGLTPGKAVASVSPPATRPPRQALKPPPAKKNRAPEPAQTARPVRASLTPPPTPAPASPPALSRPAPASVPGSAAAGRGPTAAGDGAGNAGNQAAGGSGVGGLGASGPGAGGGSGVGDAKTMAQVQRQYLNLVRARILAKRNYPLLARQQHQEGTVRLRFTLAPSGRLAEEVQVVKPSGFKLLDDQARQCVLTAAPFPPFPQELRCPSLTVEVPIVYKLTEWGT